MEFDIYIYIENRKIYAEKLDYTKHLNDISFSCFQKAKTFQDPNNSNCILQIYTYTSLQLSNFKTDLDDITVKFNRFNAISKISELGTPLESIEGNKIESNDPIPLKQVLKKLLDKNNLWQRYQSSLFKIADSYKELSKTLIKPKLGEQLTQEQEQANERIKQEIGVVVVHNLARLEQRRKETNCEIPNIQCEKLIELEEKRLEVLAAINQFDFSVLSYDNDITKESKLKKYRVYSYFFDDANKAIVKIKVDDFGYHIDILKLHPILWNNLPWVFKAAYNDLKGTYTKKLVFDDKTLQEKEEDQKESCICT